jgi:hypothetical protein
MSNSTKGMIAGFVATLVLTVLMLIQSAVNYMPEVHLIKLLVNLGSIQVVAAWMDHYIVGVVVWGLLFGAFDAVATRLPYWLKGLIFGAFAWLVAMMLFMPLAKAGFFAQRLGRDAIIFMLALHLIYGLVLGIVYGVISAWAPPKPETSGLPPMGPGPGPGVKAP